MEEDLKYIFSNINDWLKFAEAKCAGLLALNLAAIIGLLQAQSMFSDDIKDGQGILLVIFSISSIVALYSLIPKLNTLIKFYKTIPDLNVELERRSRLEKPTLNCIYFGDIACLTEAMYSDLATSKPLKDHNSLTQLLIHQIVINAKIAYQKYRIFSIASWITFLGYFFGIILIIWTRL